jgi:hypothetical protein
MKKIIILLITILIFNCNSEDSNSIVETELSLLTGINLIDNNGNPNGKFGNPNILINNQITVYPIPVKNVIFINSNENISTVWIIPAIAEKIYQQTDFNTKLNTDTYNENQIKSTAEIESLDINKNSFSLNLSTLKSGYYRIFMKIDNSLYWENIYIPNGDEGFGLESLKNFWN